VLPVGVRTYSAHRTKRTPTAKILKLTVLFVLHFPLAMKQFRFGTWNVRSLYRTGSLTAAARELARYKWNVGV
jgi:hypothetical protein